MTFSTLSPTWFFGYDVVMELAFAITCLVISLFAFKIFKVTDQRQIKLFGISFGIISASYFAQSLFNFLIISELNENISAAIELNSVLLFDAFGILVHVILMTTGLAVLAYMTLRTEKARIFWFMLALTMLGIFLSVNKIYMFYLFMSLYCIFLVIHFTENYFRHRQGKTLLIALAFLFLLFGNIHFLISVNHQLFYVIGHALELLAYVLIIINLYLVLRK
ncbi:hypothetical protein JW711_01715 [Candidatus Woesearchaeota archaeon]|nr:hypothetical protein [Candidatus Woesearchaeota archaeon]